MELKLMTHNLLTEDDSMLTVTLKDDASISDLLQAAGYATADFSGYYPFSGKLCFGDPYLPYVISDRKVLYDVPFDTARVADFINTMEIADQKIEITVGMPWAGGPGLCDVVQMWESAKPVFEAVAIFCSISGISVMMIIERICNLFKKRRQKPQTIFDIVYRKQMWNHHELAALLEIEPERAKDILKLLGYQYDNSRKLYTQKDNIEDIKRELTQIQSLDI